MATTRPGQQGVGVRPYAGFSPKSPASGPKSSATVTRLLSIGIGGRRRKSGKGTGPFTRLTSMAINGRRVSFIAKKPASGGKGTGEFTRLLTFGIGGRRVSFEAKKAVITDDGTGAAKKVTTEELEGLEAYHKARQGITDSQDITEEILTPTLPEIPILQEEAETLDIPDFAVVEYGEEIPESQVELETKEIQETEEIDDIRLILAIIEATQ